MKVSAMRGLGLAAVFGVCAASVGAAELKVGKKAKVYTGSEGETVTIVPVDPSGSGDFLVKFEGIEGEFEDQVLLHHRSGKGEREDYKLDGSDYVSITVRGGSMQVHPKGTNAQVHVRFAKEESAKAQPQAVLTEYLGKKGKKSEGEN